jgi:hypothetical protein
MGLIAKALTLGTALFMVGCSTMKADEEIAHNKAMQSYVYLGMPSQEFLSFWRDDYLADKDMTREPTRFAKDGSIYTIYYVRTNRIADGASTDDEYTPYVFANDRLQAFGWEVLGGPKNTSWALEAASRSRPPKEKKRPEWKTKDLCLDGLRTYEC